MLLTLIAPASPLSVVTRMRTASIFSAYGLVACTAACARRSLVAATTCMALVIFCVFLMLSIRRTMSLYAGNYFEAFFRGGGLGFFPSPLGGRSAAGRVGGAEPAGGAGSGTSL